MFQLNPDLKIVTAIRKRLKETGGYCPCKPEHENDPSYLCPCKEFRDHKKCCCGLFIAVSEELVPLDAINRSLMDCQCCPLYSTRTKVVPGEGPSTAKIMIVGEAPGSKEDQEGHPFVGGAGKNLSKLLEECGVRRELTFITNIVKCRPFNAKGDRRPNAAECLACAPYLLGQIQVIKPKVIIAVGLTASQRLLKARESIEILREGKHVFENIPVIPTFHTSGLGLYRRPNRIEAVKEDLRRALAIANDEASR